jgi:hypothetical protein
MRRTVFILGAGSSAVFGFPVGQTLCQTVCSSHGGFPGLSSQQFRDCTGFRENEIRRFCDELLMSAQPSVDAFLEYRQEFLDLGKAAMAVTLINKEIPANLWSFEETNWMRYMFSRLNAPFERFHEIPVSFITFNYDRS